MKYICAFVRQKGGGTLCLYRLTRKNCSTERLSALLNKALPCTSAFSYRVRNARNIPSCASNTTMTTTGSTSSSSGAARLTIRPKSGSANLLPTASVFTGTASVCKHPPATVICSLPTHTKSAPSRIRPAEAGSSPATKRALKLRNGLSAA